MNHPERINESSSAATNDLGCSRSNVRRKTKLQTRQTKMVRDTCLHPVRAMPPELHRTILMRHSLLCFETKKHGACDVVGPSHRSIGISNIAVYIDLAYREIESIVLYSTGLSKTFTSQVYNARNIADQPVRSLKFETVANKSDSRGA